MQQGSHRAAVISADADLRARVVRLAKDPRHALGRVQQVPSTLEDLPASTVDELKRSELKLVFVDVGSDPALGLRLARVLFEADPSRIILLAGPAVTPDVLMEAMRAGAAEYLTQPIGDEELGAAIGRAARRMGGAAGKPTRTGRLITLVGAKGGAGTTTAATNLAVHIHQSSQKRTLLLDLDLELGAVATLLSLQPRYSFFDLVSNLHRIDGSLLESLTERYESGLEVLASPTQPNVSEAVAAEQTGRALEVIRQHYEYVVVDVARFASPATRPAIEQADLVLLVTTPDLLALRNAKKLLPLLERAIPSGSQVHVLLNQVGKDTLVSPADVARTLDREVFWTIDADPETVALSVNAGVPAVLGRKSKYVRGIRGLGDMLSESPNGNHQGGGLSGLFRFRRSKTTADESGGDE